jgi:hypothetical protein
MKEEFTSSAQEYRDVCYMLLGYKVDRTGHKNYRLVHYIVTIGTIAEI